MGEIDSLTSKDKLIGKNIDDYQVLELAGVGGFSRVYRVQPKDLEGQVFALKLVKNVHQPLLEAEARILACLKHPQIPYPIKLGVCEEGSYLVMQLIPENLQKYQDSFPGSKLPVTEALRLTSEVLEILHYAHSRGVIHKDLKPSNIGLTVNPSLRNDLRKNEDNNVRHPVLLDFNISNSTNFVAKIQKETPIDNTAVVNSQIINIEGVERSLIGGTEGYASPEQRKVKVEGVIHSVGAGTDVYAMGVILYQMLTGYLPQGVYKPASHVNKNVSPWVDKIIADALAPNPQDRFKDAKTMYWVIQQGEPKKEPQISVRERVQGFRANLSRKLAGGINFVKSLWPYAVVPLIAIAIIAGFIAFIATLVQHNNESQKKYIEELKVLKPTGSIIYKKDSHLCSFSAKDITEDDIHLTEISCPCYVRDIAYLGSMSVAWIGEHHYNGYTQSRGAVYVTDLRTKVTRQILVATALTDDLYKSWGTEYAYDIENITTCGNAIYIKTSKGHWYKIIDGHPYSATGSIESDAVGQVSPDGLLRVGTGANNNIFIQKSNDTSNAKYLNFGGSEPLWVADEK